jgi:hypothetical protein
MVTPLAKIYTHDGIGAFRAVAVDTEGRASRLFELRWGGQNQALRLGETVSARIRNFADRQGGAFLELETGQEVFLALKSRDGLTEGQAVRVTCVAAHRSGKLARVKLAKGVAEDEPFDAFASWLASLPNGAHLPQVAEAEQVRFAFEEALCHTITLPKGGQIHIEPTRAAVAIDVDSAGHLGKGSAGARALSLNKQAVEEAARQVALRDLGGAVIVDCISPTNRSGAEQIKAHFQSVFQALSTRTVRTASPLPFGLLQAAISWGETPLTDVYFDAAGKMAAEIRLLNWLDQAEREALSSPTVFLNLNLCAETYAAYLAVKEICDLRIQARLSGRLTITNNGNEPEGIKRR